ncbi:MAG: family oxidoreductase [Akkermansiaceae bacterium]|nr:family oxidoreductase [Akkermansiaceae bacterium]
MKNSGKVVIVTGAASGIGKGIATRLLAEGWQVVAADRDVMGLADLADQPGNHRLQAVVTDVSKGEEVKNLIARTLERHDRLDAIVSNAGISEFKSLAESTLEDWNRVLAINLTGAFLLAKEGEHALRAAKGAMVLIASSRAHMSEPDTHAYSASKGGQVALSHSLAISLGPDVRVNCISPGWINVSGEALSGKDHAQHPAGRVGTPDDIAAAVSYLIGEDAGFVTGAELIVDGGMTRKMIYV